MVKPGSGTAALGPRRQGPWPAMYNYRYIEVYSLACTYRLLHAALVNLCSNWVINKVYQVV